jgi:hydroxycarboxylate dehydrogenase B
LGAALTGGETTRPENKPTHGIWNNMLAIVFDAERFGTGARFGTEAAAFIEWVKSARTQPGFDEILVPGEPERNARTARASGFLIDTETLAQMDRASSLIAAKHGVSAGPVSILAK